MGERVYVSVGEPRVNPPPPPESAPGTKPVEPINYADSYTPPRYEEQFLGLIRRLGGLPQIVFAAGLGIVLAAIAGRYYGFWALIGGIMIGLVVRVPLRLDW